VPWSGRAEERKGFGGTELDAGRDEELLRVAREQRPLLLHGADRRHGARRAQVRRAALRQADVLDQALLLELGAGARELGGELRVRGAVGVVQVDVVEAEPLELLEAGGLHRLVVVRV